MKALRPVAAGIAVGITLLTTPAAHAATASEALSTCLAENTTGKERKEFARWMFAAMSAHPALSDMSAITPAIREQSNRNMGQMVTRLMAVDCVTQTRAAAKEGRKSMAVAFKTLGELAMLELTSNPAVGTAIGDFEKHIDSEKLQAAFGGGK